MAAVKIKILTIGHIPMNFNPEKINNWKSEIFEIDGPIENYELRCDSDSFDWQFSDSLVKSQLPSSFKSDYLIAITNVPLEDNWYARRLGDNKIIFTFHQIKDILEHYNIPLENAIYRIMYSYTLLYKRSGDKIPSFAENPSFTHDETRGCLFDMNGIKMDIIASCNNPVICSECEERLKREKVSNHLINSTKREITRIRKDLYYRAVDFTKSKPIWALTLSSFFAITIGIITSSIYDAIKFAMGIK